MLVYIQRYNVWSEVQNRVRTDFRPANLRQTSFRPQIFVPQFFCPAFFVALFFNRVFSCIAFFRPLTFSFRYFFVCSSFRSCNSSSEKMRDEKLRDEKMHRRKNAD